MKKPEKDENQENNTMEMKKSIIQKIEIKDINVIFLMIKKNKLKYLFNNYL